MYLKTNKLTVAEKKWIDENSQTSTLINVNVLNNSAVFGDSGSGVFYDFLSSFENEYNLNINKVTFNNGANVIGTSLNVKNEINESDDVIYIDHYVLISNSYEIISSPFDIKGTISILSSDSKNVTKYLTNYNLSYSTYDNIDDLMSSFEENKYVEEKCVHGHSWLLTEQSENVEKHSNCKVTHGINKEFTPS